jgi:alkanesulfonate monooxygenase SsuD/methylene tetrahydromethanopterin reductase-like flavin-dependent oxidoreductase (luciferase family)
MRLGLVLQGDYSAPGLLDQQVATVKIAEDLGYEVLCSAETWGLSALPWLTVMARETSRIQLGSSIINVFARSPGAVAQEFAALDVISGGRALLGLGSSASAVIEHFHGVPFTRPLRRLREYIEIFRMLIAGERLQYEGELFRLERGFRLDYERPRDRIPVYIAAITPRSIRQTAEIADGVFPLHWPQSRLGELRRELDDVAAAAGRGAGAVEIVPQTSVWLIEGDGGEQQWAAARGELEHYTNRMGDFYWQLFERSGYEAEVAASRSAAAARDREGAAGAISERMVRDIAAIGSVEEIREQLQERSDQGADVQLLKHLPWEPRAAAPILEALVR